MKRINHLTLLAILLASALITASVQAATIIRSKSNITNNRTINKGWVVNNLSVKCTSCKPQTDSTQPVTADRNGTITAIFRNPGTYTVSAADGANIGEVLQILTVSKAGTMPLLLELAVP